MAITESKIYLDKITCNKSKVEYYFHAEGAIKSTIKPKAVFEIDFYENIEKVPLSILAIPFVTNVLPAVWLYNAQLILPELDSDFYSNLNKIRSGYSAMYPKLKFSGGVDAEKIVKNSRKNSNKSQPALLFSGGVDATSSLITLLTKGAKPRLITLWGSDVGLNDLAGWREKSNHTKLIASEFSLDVSFIRTDFRGFLEEGVLNRQVAKGTDDQWWHGFQHGIGIIGHAAPLVYLHGIDVVYIAASFTRGEAISCASDPTIDEYVCVAGCKTIHDGYDYSRQDKIANIHNFVVKSGIKKLPIKVCWISLGAKNCGQCEKCMRTAVGFLVEGGDLRVYDLANYSADYARHYITDIHYFRHTLQWERIQKRLRETRSNLDGKTLHHVEWLLAVDLETVNNKFTKKVRHYIKMAKGGVTNRIPPRTKATIKRALKRGRTR